MHRKILGIFIAMVALVFMGCPNPTTNTPASDAAINLLAIPGVTPPILGATPVTAITATAQYAGTIVWSGTPATFAGSTVYTATIPLTAKAGFTLIGVAADFFTVTDTTSDTNGISLTRSSSTITILSVPILPNSVHIIDICTQRTDTGTYELV